MQKISGKEIYSFTSVILSFGNYKHEILILRVAFKVMVMYSVHLSTILNF